MALNVDIQLTGSLSAGIPGLAVESIDLVSAIAELYELTATFESTDPALDMNDIVGHEVTVLLNDEPFLPTVKGIIRRARQLSCEPTGMSLYEIVVVPPLWLTTQRSRHTIHQNASSIDVASTLLADYGGAIPRSRFTVVAAPRVREYIAQWGETDHDLMFRLLAEDGFASYFDLASGAWIVVDDTALIRSPGPTSVPFLPPSNLTPVTSSFPRVTSVETTSRLTTSAVTVRDYDPENPRLLLEATAFADPTALFANEAGLEDSDFALGDFTSPPEGAQIAERRLRALASTRHRLSCEATFALAAGTEWSMTGHPRAEMARPLLVVRARTSLRSRAGGTTARHVLDCVDAGTSFHPPARPKPRVHGTQTGRVVAGSPGSTAEIDVDSLGRVLVELHWDRRRLGAGTSRRVRVARAWAGPGYGIVAMPRVGDEVLVAYMDGDPDQPLVVGSVHNVVERSPLTLPGEETISIWRTRSSPGGGGFNQLLMDDQKGAERLEVHAERDFRLDVGNSSIVNVAGSQSTSIGGNAPAKVGGDVTIDISGTLSVTAPTVEVSAQNQVAFDTPVMFVDAGILIENSDAHSISSKSVWMDSNGPVEINGKTCVIKGENEIILRGGNITIEGTTITMKATGGDVVINGQTIKLNC